MTLPTSSGQAPGEERELRDAMSRDIAFAHECLTALILAVHAGDLNGIEVRLRGLQALGSRIESADLVQWCAVVPPLHAPDDVVGVVGMLPMLIAAWERTQQALVSGAFGTAGGAAIAGEERTGPVSARSAEALTVDLLESS